MSSVGQAVGGLVGGTIGFFLGNPLYGAQIGIMIGGLIDPPKGPAGPRLEDLSVQTSTYGAFIPRPYGTVALNGNVMWLLNDKLTESEVTSGGKGGPEISTFEYSATFAVGLCKGPILGVRRIWVGADLWYDAGSDDLAAIIASNEHADAFTLYLGTDTQEADPLIAADRGVANVPGYRGLAYIVFDNLPLAKYGNSLMGAQVRVEVVSAGATSGWGIIDTFTGENEVSEHDQAITFADENGFYEWTIDEVNTPPDPSLFTIWRVDYSTGTRVKYKSIQAAPDYAIYTGGACYGKVHGYGDCRHIALAHSVPYGMSILEENGALHYSSPTDPTSNRCIEVYCYVGGVLVYSASEGVIDYKRIVVHDFNTGALEQYDLPTASTTVGSIAISNNRVFVCSGVSGRVAVFDLDSRTWLLDQTFLAFAGVSNNGGTYSWSGDPSRDELFCCNNGIILRIDTVDYSVESVVSSADMFGPVFKSRRFWPIGEDMLIGRRIPLNIGDTTYAVAHARNLITSDAVQLGDVVEAECLQSRLLEATDLDVTELTDGVRGYRVSQLGPIRNGLTPLRSAWPFDVVQHGYEIKFVRRGGASVVTIPAADLGATAAGESTGVQVEDSREMDLMLPRKVRVKYLDAVRDYDINEQIAERINTDAVNEVTVDLPIVFNADEAAGKAETLLYVAWLERNDVRITLPPTYLNLEPGDIVTVEAEHATYELRLSSIEYLADGRLACIAKYSSASVYTPTAVGEEGQGAGATLGLAGPTELVLMDIPLMVDDQDTAGFPVAMGGHSASWPGSVLYRSTDGGQTWVDLVAQTSPGPIISYALNSIGSHGGTVYDFASVLTVRPSGSGTLSSVTESQVFAGQNWFAYGAHGRWEIIAARSVTNNGDGTFALFDLLRGQHGTEWATGLHAAYDSVVLLDQAVIGFVSVNSSTIGAEYLYRGVTSGKTLDSAGDFEFAYAGVNLECLSPVHLTGNMVRTTNDWSLSWVRRSRFSGWRDYVDTPLGETSEAYTVSIYADASFTTVVRTIAVTSASATYTSAEQVADFGQNVISLSIGVTQTSAIAGAGYEARATLTGGGLAIALLHFNGADASTTFTDETGGAWSRAGNAQIDTAQSQFGGASALFDGTGDRVYSSHANFALGTADFTLEFWARPTSGGGGNYARFVQIGTNSTNGGLWLIKDTTSNPPRLFLQTYGGGSYENVFTASAATELANDTWAHVALVRSGATFKLFIDGVLSASGTAVYGNITQTTFSIGANSSNGEAYNGHIDELRLTQGLALYDADFTPPTGEFSL